MAKKVTTYKIAFVDRDDALIDKVIGELVRMKVQVMLVSEKNVEEAKVEEVKIEAKPVVESPRIVRPSRAFNPLNPHQPRSSGYRKRSTATGQVCTGPEKVLEFIRSNNGTCKTNEVYEHVVSLGYARSSVSAFLSVLRATGKIEYDAYSVISSD